MKIVVHDYGGYAFCVQLSRALARMGHSVTHVYSASVQSPQGALTVRCDDPETLDIVGIDLGSPIAKYSFMKRRRQEQQHGRRVADLIQRLRPDVVLSANTPPDAQARIQRASRAAEARFVFWLQDSFGVGVDKVLRRKLPVVGKPIAWYYGWLETALIRRSDDVVVITEDFLSLVDVENASSGTVHVIPNWAPLEETEVHPKTNAWAREHGLDDKKCLLYSGTLGLKHNPGLVLELARHFEDDPDVRIVVVSEGMGADWLRQERDEHELDNLILLRFQPFERLPEMLGAADVLVAILERDASLYSVPSKVLTYLCAGRPLLLAVPPDNLSARIVRDYDAGYVVPPSDVEGFIECAEKLLGAPLTRSEMGSNARSYAESTFDIDAIASRFERICSRAGGRKGDRRDRRLTTRSQEIR